VWASTDGYRALQKGKENVNREPDTEEWRAGVAFEHQSLRLASGLDGVCALRGPRLARRDARQSAVIWRNGHNKSVN